MTRMSGVGLQAHRSAFSHAIPLIERALAIRLQVLGAQWRSRRPRVRTRDRRGWSLRRSCGRSRHTCEPKRSRASTSYT